MLVRMQGKTEPSNNVGENVNYCSHCGHQYGSSSKIYNQLGTSGSCL
jgi:hypothetical protein